MFRRRLYYTVKPYLPWNLRVGIRRFFALRKRAASRAIWPINEVASLPPAGWPGWPEGNTFAFVITHDVEGPSGLAKCKQLAEMELQLGFRSSFNFIPEGTYRVPSDLRQWLTDNGFEVGVHDLHHDGKLYDSYEGFKSKAALINRYAREWNAVGFRAGFMLRNLDWIHELDIRYDASTFDTDPFEPQPDGAGTIFPFWIPRPTGGGRWAPVFSELTSGTQRGHSIAPLHDSAAPHSPSPRTAAPVAKEGYIELPYTLPQDSTLFLVLREKSPSIWLEKTDWIAKTGGMALVNVHPDYLQFEGEPPSASTFPIAHYRDLLLHVREAHRRRCWRPLPKEVAAFAESVLRPARPPA